MLRVTGKTKCLGPGHTLKRTAAGRAQGSLLGRALHVTNPCPISHSLTPNMLCKLEGALEYGRIQDPLPRTYNPSITSHGTSLLFCEMGIIIIAYPLHRLEACSENKREKYVLVSCRVPFSSEIFEKPGKCLFYILRTKVLFK